MRWSYEPKITGSNPVWSISAFPPRCCGNQEALIILSSTLKHYTKFETLEMHSDMSGLDVWMDGCLENTKRRGKKAISVLGLLVVNTVTHDGAERLLATRVALERMAFESLQPAKGGA